MIDLHGVYAASITPRSAGGEIDYGAAFELIDFLCHAGVNGIALGTAAGEYAALTNAERSRLAYLAVKRSRVPVIAGVGSATLDGSLELAREAASAGVAAVLVPPPYFTACDQEDLREFYLEFAGHHGAPAILGQLPMPGPNLDAETALELLSTGRFAGIELRAGAIEKIVSLGGVNGHLLLASDLESYGAARAAGARAGLSSAACAVPELASAIERALKAADAGRAAALEAWLDEFLAWVAQFPMPAIVKVATGLRGLKTGTLTLPLAPEKRKKLDEFRAWFAGWLPQMRKVAADG